MFFEFLNKKVNNVKLSRLKFEILIELLNIFLSFLHISKKNVKIEIKKWRNSNDSRRII